MIIKKALMSYEIDKVRQFLLENGLKFDSDITETFFIVEENTIIASVSRNGYVIKDLAVDLLYRGENLGGMLVSEVLNSMRQEHIFYYQVFTKTEYVPVFSSLGFKLVEKTDKVAILEAGESKIESEILKMKTQIENHFSITLEKTDIGAIVVNCNPITKGHFQLILESAKKHTYFLVLVVEEDQSTFTYTERFLLVKTALKNYANIIVLPSTKYIVSALTFPSYFLKSIDEAEREHAKLDAMIFKDYFMKILNISKRYIGSETEPVMVAYNQLLQDYLQDAIVLNKRFEHRGIVISASLVRKLLYENKIEAASEYVPDNIKSLFIKIAKEKYDKQKR